MSAYLGTRQSQMKRWVMRPESTMLNAAVTILLIYFSDWDRNHEDCWPAHCINVETELVSVKS